MILFLIVVFIILLCIQFVMSEPDKNNYEHATFQYDDNNSSFTYDDVAGKTINDLIDKKELNTNTLYVNELRTQVLDSPNIEVEELLISRDNLIIEPVCKWEGDGIPFQDMQGAKTLDYLNRIMNWNSIKCPPHSYMNGIRLENKDGWGFMRIVPRCCTLSKE